MSDRMKHLFTNLYTQLLLSHCGGKNCKRNLKLKLLARTGCTTTVVTKKQRYHIDWVCGATVCVWLSAAACGSAALVASCRKQILYVLRSRVFVQVFRRVPVKRKQTLLKDVVETLKIQPTTPLMVRNKGPFTRRD